MREYKIMFFTDDDHDDLYLLKEVAESLGHTAQIFHDGHEMLAALNTETEKPDLIFLDINMPKIDGFQVLEKVRSYEDDLNAIPVIIHSGHTDDKYIEKCLELGANYYIPKAHSYNQLKSSINYALNTNWAAFKADRENFLHKHS
ncbi:response regulator [Flavobacterium sp.]|uniref:response regulator n=1 Tax=Flavobacterium sp. TaxID=239 RepID=UPI0025D9C7C2|nr:response regulator [Flavobacterium sp.]